MKTVPKNTWFKYLLITTPIFTPLLIMNKPISKKIETIEITKKISQREEITFIVKKDFEFREEKIQTGEDLFLTYNKKIVVVTSSSGKIFRIDPYKMTREEAVKYLKFVDLKK